MRLLKLEVAALAILFSTQASAMCFGSDSFSSYFPSTNGNGVINEHAFDAHLNLRKHTITTKIRSISMTGYLKKHIVHSYPYRNPAIQCSDNSIVNYDIYVKGSVFIFPAFNGTAAPNENEVRERELVLALALDNANGTCQSTEPAMADLLVEAYNHNKVVTIEYTSPASFTTPIKDCHEDGSTIYQTRIQYFPGYITSVSIRNRTINPLPRPTVKDGIVKPILNDIPIKNPE